MHLELTGAEVRGLYSGHDPGTYSATVQVAFFGVLEAVEAAVSESELRSLTSIHASERPEDRLSISLAEGYSLQIRKRRHRDGAACMAIERITRDSDG